MPRKYASGNSGLSDHSKTVLDWGTIPRLVRKTNCSSTGKNQGDLCVHGFLAMPRSNFQTPEPQAIGETIPAGAAGARIVVCISALKQDLLPGER